MRNIKLTIAYDGTAYSGWQIQPNGVTIQELVQRSVRKITGEKNNLIGASRTDAGVHALSQVATFKTEKKLALDSIRKGINHHLPPDIRVISAEEVDEDFHPIRNAKRKTYHYMIATAEFEHPLFLNRSWIIKRKLNVVAMKKAAKHLVGEHDFSSFRASDGGDKSRVRKMFAVNVLNLCHSEGGTTEESPMFRGSFTTFRMTGCCISITGSGFLKHMVRNIVGTLVDVGLGKTSPAQFKKILEAKDRKKAGATAPASGLYLVEIVYGLVAGGVVAGVVSKFGASP